MITVLHRGGYAQMITILHGGGSLGTPNLYYVINGQPLTAEVETKAVFVLKDNVRSQFLS